MLQLSRRLLWTSTPARRRYAARWLPWLLRDDPDGAATVRKLLNGAPARWVNALAGISSVSWIVLVRRPGCRGQSLACGPTLRQVQDLAQVMCGVRDDAWLLRQYPGPLNHTGQARVEQVSVAIANLLSRVVAESRRERIAIASHVAGDAFHDLHVSANWDFEEAQSALIRACEHFSISASTNSVEDN